jgi:hypothetical protein
MFEWAEISHQDSVWGASERWMLNLILEANLICVFELKKRDQFRLLPIDRIAA